MTQSARRLAHKTCIEMERQNSSCSDAAVLFFRSSNILREYARRISAN